MSERPIQVLLVEDEADHAFLFQRMLTTDQLSRFEVERVEWLAEAVKRLRAGGVDVVLLDLTLPDARGLETFTRLHEHAPDVPIVVLTGLADDALAVQAVRDGAQDYLVKGEVDGALLARAIRYAIERNRLQVQLRGLSLVDELTRLHNRRGFLILAEQQLRLARRSQRSFLLFFLDLDGMKKTNDNYGHAAGDRMLLEAADILRKTFRGSDIIARLGGDEFAVVAVDAAGEPNERPAQQLQEKLAELSMRSSLPYPLSLSAGVVRSDPHREEAIEELLAKADAAMYEHKRSKHRGGPA